MESPNSLAMSCANLREGLYLFFSRKTIVSRRTPTFRASSSWDIFFPALNSRIRLRMLHPEQFNADPADKKDQRHSQNTCSDQTMRFQGYAVTEVHDN